MGLTTVSLATAFPTGMATASLVGALAAASTATSIAGSAAVSTQGSVLAKGLVSWLEQRSFRSMMIITAINISFGIFIVIF